MFIITVALYILLCCLFFIFIYNRNFNNIDINIDISNPDLHDNDYYCAYNNEHSTLL